MFIDLPSQPNRFDPQVEDARARHRNKFVRAEATPSLMPNGSPGATSLLLPQDSAFAARTSSHNRHRRQVSFGGTELNTSSVGSHGSPTALISHTPTSSFAFDGGMSFHISGNPRDFLFGEDAPASAMKGVRNPADHRRTVSELQENESLASPLILEQSAAQGPSHQYLLRRENQSSARRLAREANAPSTSRLAAEKNQQRYLASATHRDVFDPDTFKSAGGLVQSAAKGTPRGMDQRRKSAIVGDLMSWNRNADVMEGMKESHFRPIPALPRRRENPTIQALNDLNEAIADRSTVGSSELFHTHVYQPAYPNQQRLAVKSTPTAVQRHPQQQTLTAPGSGSVLDSTPFHYQGRKFSSHSAAPQPSYQRDRSPLVVQGYSKDRQLSAADGMVKTPARGFVAARQDWNGSQPAAPLASDPPPAAVVNRPCYFSQIPPPYAGPSTPVGLLYAPSSPSREATRKSRYCGFDGDMDGDGVPDDGRVDIESLPPWVGLPEAAVVAGLLESQGVDAIKHTEISKYHLHPDFLDDIKQLMIRGGYLVRYAPLRVGDVVGPDPKERFFRIQLVGANNGIRTVGYSRDEYLRIKHTKGKNKRGTKGLTEGGGKERTFQRAILHCQENSHPSALTVAKYELSNLVGVTRDVSTAGFTPHRVFKDGSVGGEGVAQLVVPLAPHPIQAAFARRQEYKHHQQRLLQALKEHVVGVQGHRFASGDRQYRLLHADNAFGMWFLNYVTDEVDLVEVCAQSPSEADLWCRVLKGMLAVNSTRLEPKPKKIKKVDSNLANMIRVRREREQLYAAAGGGGHRDSGASEMLVLSTSSVGKRKIALPPQEPYEDEFYDVEGDTTTDEDTDNSDHEQEVANSQKPALEMLHALCRFVIDTRGSEHLTRQAAMDRL